MTEIRGASNAKAKRDLGWQPGASQLAPGVDRVSDRGRLLDPTARRPPTGRHRRNRPDRRRDPAGGWIVDAEGEYSRAKRRYRLREQGHQQDRAGWVSKVDISGISP